MRSLQDKICNGLTLAVLLAVIGFGTASLLAEAGAEERGTAAPIEEAAADEMPTDEPLATMEELPALEDRPQTASPLPADSLDGDTLGLSATPATEPSDTAHTAAPTEPAAPAIHPSEETAAPHEAPAEAERTN